MPLTGPMQLGLTALDMLVSDMQAGMLCMGMGMGSVSAHCMHDHACLRAFSFAASPNSVMMAVYQTAITYGVTQELAGMLLDTWCC